jgi:signal transduction histidine kinase
VVLTFRQRIFGWLVTIAVVPALIAVLYAVLGPRYEVPPGGARAWEEAAATFREVRARTNRAALSPGMRLALDRHAEQLNTSVRHARQAEAISVAFSGILAGAAIALAVLVLGGAVRLAGHLSRQLSRPIDELVAWTGRIRRGEPIPDAPPARGAPEFGVLRESLRTMAGELERARANEVEAAELRAFRDMAKNVAHELKNPLTPIRFAVERLSRDAPPEHKELLAVLTSESERLETMARDFAELGRLPQGPTAPVDMGELLDELSRGGPSDVAVKVTKQAGTPLVNGHYEPLRRALHNLVINAIDAVKERREARGERREVSLGVRPLPDRATPSVEVTVRDTGVGIRPGDIARVFEPHFTTKTNGTGLGLAIVRQTIRYHGGTISISSEPGRGTTVTVVLPVTPPAATS